MKRFLSILLAIMLVATLLPAGQVFAEEGEVANAGYTIKYDISGFMDANNYGWSTNGTWLTDMSFENTNGFFDFHSSSIGNAETVDSKLRCNGNDQIQIGSGTVVFFEIYVPVSGTYTMYINHKKASNGNTASVYMNQGDAPSNAWNYQIGYLNSKSDTEELNARSAVTSDSAFTTPAQIELAAGYHYLTFKCPSYSWIGTIELVSGDGSQTVLTSMKTSIDKNVLAVGGEAAKMSVDSFWLSDATVAEGKTYVVTYSSGDESVARVNSSTGEITAVGEGKTEITATATNEAGVEITASEDVVVADGAIIKYDIVGHIKDLGYKEVSDVTYSLEGFTEDVTDGFYSFFPGSGSNVSNDHDHSRVKYYENIQVMTVGTKVAFKINVPVAGYYNVVHDIINATVSDKYAKRKDTDVGVYVSKDGIDVSLASYIGKFNLYSDDYDQGEKRQATSGMVKFDEPGSYILTFKVDKSNQGASDAFSAIYSFYLVGGTKDALMNGKITSSVSSINVDEGETAEVVATGYLSSTTEAATFTYSSSNTAVATVDEESGVVTPVAEGVAIITATANADLANTLATEIEVTCNKPGEAVADTKVNFMASAEEGGTVTDNKLVKEVAIGSNVTVEATANDGYEFAYWRNASGKHLSSNAKETFKVNTNTAVIAVFDKVKVEEGDTTAPVYFYNENGSLIEKKDVALG
ncbi:MAG: Ig-like domain-containing protein, partial [Oscillospiraceae bacterium]|nr:Ig-like domain-containing protein [Oscillospiraceae bacterium]